MSGRSIIPKVMNRFSYEATFRRALHLKSRHIHQPNAEALAIGAGPRFLCP